MSIELTTDMFDSKRVAVVGNGVNILQRKDGAWIDEHDVIVRFNFEFPISERSENIGNRTDVMVCAPGLCRKMHRDGRLNQIRRNNPDTLFLFSIRKPGNILKYHLPTKVRTECKKWGGYCPTSGVIMVHSLMTVFTPTDVTVFGFDGLKSGSLSERAFPNKFNPNCNRETNPMGNHRPKREQAWLESIKDKLTVVEYE